MRSYGLPDSQPVSVPKATKPQSEVEPCPVCGCESVMQITLKVKQRLIKGGEGTGVYLGCPACPWASPMMVTSDKAVKN